MLRLGLVDSANANIGDWYQSYSFYWVDAMHICFICNEYPGFVPTYGGVGTFTRTLARALVHSGHQATVVGLYDQGGAVEDSGVNLLQVQQQRRKGSGVIANMGRLRAAVAGIHSANPIDILDSPEVGLAPFLRTPGFTKIVRMNGGHHFFAHTLGKRPRLLRGALEKLSFANANIVCAVSSFVAEETRRLLKLGSRRIEVIPNPVDTVRFAPRPAISPIVGRIVFVGTLCEKKGIRQLVQAMPLILRHAPDAHLVACGRDWRDPITGASYLEELRREIDLSLVNRIEFCGVVPNDRLPEVLASAEVLVYPSHMEALPVAWIEGLAMGRPVVASRTGPGPEVIEHSVSGMLCDPYDPSDIAAKVIAVLRDSALARDLGQAGRKRVEEQFSIDVLVKRNLQFYERCLRRTIEPIAL